MDWYRQCAGLIPCRDEAATLAAVISGVRRFLPAVVVIDDGSRDATGRVAEENGADLIRFTKSHGKGAALDAGLTWAWENGFEWALTLDGDGQHDPEDIPRLMGLAEVQPAAMVVGDRLTHGAHDMPWVRREVNRWMSRRLSRMTGNELPDSQCGFRLINLSAWASLELQSGHFVYESEVLVAFLRAGFSVRFTPIRVIYRDEFSQIRAVTDSWRWLNWWRRSRRGEFAVEGGAMAANRSCQGQGGKLGCHTLWKKSSS